MTLLQELAKKQVKPSYQIYLAGQSIRVINAQVDFGWDVISSSAVVLTPDVPAVQQLRTEIEIWLGYSGFTIGRFRGYITDITRSYFPFGYQIRAAGYSKLTQNPYPAAVEYASQTEISIADDLLSRSGIVDRYVEGATTVLGVVQPVTLDNGTPPSSLLSLMGDSFGYKVFDVNDGFVQRQAISGRPATSAAYNYIQGFNISSISRNEGNVDEINNRVDVFGLDQGDVPQWPVSREASNPLVPDPPGFIPAKLPSDLIETEEVASEQAIRIISDVNGTPDEVVIEPDNANPYIMPGVTISVTSEKVNLASATNYLVKHVSDTLDARGYRQKITAARRMGSLGTELGKPPIAAFVFRTTKETYEISGTPTTVYTVTCDASGSFDRDGPPDLLTFAWSNNKNADTGTDLFYVTHFTQAELDDVTPPTITLVVNDADASSAAGTITKTISASDSPINARSLFVAARLRAEASGDGGETWQTWQPGSGDVISTPPIAPLNYTLFGLSDGKLYYDDSLLAIAPTLAHDFGSAINCIWVSEVDSERVTVGLANGKVMLTVDMSSVGSSVWTELVDFGNPVIDLVESFEAQGQYRVTTGETELLTYDSFATYGVPITFSGGTARAIVTSPFSNYATATHADEAKREDGTPITGISSSDVRVGAHHIRDDIFYVGAYDGQFYQKAAGGTVFTATGAIGASGTNHMINDGDNQEEFYAAHDNGLYKSFDRTMTWVRMRNYTGAGLDGLKLGRASLSLVNGQGNGKRIMLSAVVIGVPKFVWCPNIFATVPQWQANNTGLPATAINFRQLKQNPFNWAEVWAIINTDPGDGVRDELWKNPAWMTGGSWEFVADGSNWGETAIQTGITNYEFTIARENMLYVFDASHQCIVHSHDLVNFDKFITGVGGGTGGGARHIAVGQHDPDLVYFTSEFIVNTNMHLSEDGAHTHITIETSPQNDGPFIPYVGNPDDNELFSMNRWQDAVYRHTNRGKGGFASYDMSYGSGGGPPTAHIGGNSGAGGQSSVDGSLFWSFWGYHLYKSTNRMQSMSDVGDAPNLTGIECADIFQDLMWYMANSANQVWTSPSWETGSFTNRTGNIVTIIGAGFTPFSLRVDPTS